MRPRSRGCGVVCPLSMAVKNWAGSPAGEVVMAAATPKAAFMFVADDWPDIDEGEFQTHEVARALVGAMESSAPNKSDVILGATAALLGEAGFDAQREEQQGLRIPARSAGGDPGRARWPHRCGNGDGDSDAPGECTKKNPRRQRGLEKPEPTLVRHFAFRLVHFSVRSSTDPSSLPLRADYSRALALPQSCGRRFHCTS